MAGVKRAKVIGAVIYCSQEDDKGGINYFYRCVKVEDVEDGVAGLMWNPPENGLDVRDTVLGSFYERNAPRFIRQYGASDRRASGFQYVADLWDETLANNCWVPCEPDAFESIELEIANSPYKTMPQGKTMMLYKGKDCFTKSDKS